MGAPYADYFKSNIFWDSRLRVARKRVTEADLTNAVNGSAQSIAFDNPLRSGAIIMGRSIKIATLFAGGGASSVALAVGYPGQLGAVVSALETNNGSPSGRYLQGTSGTSPVGAELASQSPQLTFTPDGAHNLAALTAGDLTVELYYAVPDEHPDRT